MAFLQKEGQLKAQGQLPRKTAYSDCHKVQERSPQRSEALQLFQHCPKLLPRGPPPDEVELQSPSSELAPRGLHHTP